MGENHWTNMEKYGSPDIRPLPRGFGGTRYVGQPPPAPEPLPRCTRIEPLVLPPVVEVERPKRRPTMSESAHESRVQALMAFGRTRVEALASLRQLPADLPRLPACDYSIRGKPWSWEDVAELVRLRDMGYTYFEIGQHIGRDEEATYVKHRSFRESGQSVGSDLPKLSAGLSIRGPWSDEDGETLLRLWRAGYQLGEIARHLGRSANACGKRRNRERRARA